jgi:hypothetical protein
MIIHLSFSLTAKRILLLLFLSKHYYPQFIAMKKILFALLAFFCLQVLAFAQNTSPFFSSYPALTPGGQTLIFSYDGNLWKVPSQGGMSTRIK